jgi:predicted GNAT family acetyltransferase
MAVTLMKCEPVPTGRDSNDALKTDESFCNQLRRGEEAEVLEFLARRPIHTVFTASLIRDNGLESSHNRASFYGCRDTSGKLEGVALIGHATIIEARTENALAAFADLAGQSRSAHLIRGERKTVDSFWRHYADAGQQSRLVCRELLFQKTALSADREPIRELRLASLGDLEHVMAANASMAFEEGGINPLERDPAGFRLRTERRIQQGRVWIWVRDGKPIFKADIVGDTPEMIYLEGIHVHPQDRRKGYGKRCLTQLSSILLARSQSICLTINQRKANAVAFYAKAGFDFHSEYETIYLR